MVYCLLLTSGALLPSSLQFSLKTEQWTNILCEMSKQDTGKTFFIPVLSVLSSTFFTILGITKGKFMSKINVQHTVINCCLSDYVVAPLLLWHQCLSFFKSCHTCIEAVPYLVTLLFICILCFYLYLRGKKIGSVYTITSWWGLLWIAQILPQSF